MIIIGVGHFFMPSEKINKFFFPVTKVPETIEYKKAAKNFDKV